ncbi:MAG: hypothetical protein ACOY3E_00970 [Pseudomonadota bacterium]
MLSQLRLLAGRLLVLAIYVGLAFVGIVMLVWGFVFALAVAGGLLLLFLLMRLFGKRPAMRFSRTGTPPPYGADSRGSSATSTSGNQTGAEVIELQRRDDGSYE